MGIEIGAPEVTAPAAPEPVPRDPYRGVIVVLLAVALVGFVFAVAGGFVLTSSAVLAAAVTLGLASGVLAGVAAAQTARAQPPRPTQQELQPHEATSKRPIYLFDRIALLLRGESLGPEASPKADAPASPKRLPCTKNSAWLGRSGSLRPCWEAWRSGSCCFATSRRFRSLMTTSAIALVAVAY